MPIVIIYLNWNQTIIMNWNHTMPSNMMTGAVYGTLYSCTLCLHDNKANDKMECYGLLH